MKRRAFMQSLAAVVAAAVLWPVQASPYLAHNGSRLLTANWDGGLYSAVFPFPHPNCRCTFGLVIEPGTTAREFIEEAIRPYRG